MFDLNMLNKKRALYADGLPTNSNSEIMNDNKAGNKHMKMAATSIATHIPVVIDVEDGEIDGSEEGFEFLESFAPINMSEKVVSNRGKTLLEFELVEGDSDELRTAVAFSDQITPWIEPAKIKHRLKTVQQLHGKTDEDFISSRHVESPLGDITICLSSAEEQSRVEDEVEVIDLEEYEEQRDKYDGAKNHEKLRKLRKHCNKRKLRLRQKHEEEVREFCKAWKVKRDKIVEEHKAELAVFSVIDNPSATKMGKFTEDTNRYFVAIKDLERERQAMETKHVAEMREERIKCQKWFAVANAICVGGQSTTTNGADAHEFESHNSRQLSVNVQPIATSIDDVVPDVPANMETGSVPAANVSMQNPKDFAASDVVVNCQIVEEIPSTKRNTEADSLLLGNHRGSLLEDVGMVLVDGLNPLDVKSLNLTDNGTTREQSVLCPNPVISPQKHDVLADLPGASVSNSRVVSERSDPCANIGDSADIAGGPDEIRASEQASGDPNHVDEGAGELHKQLAIENGDYSMLPSCNNSIDSRDVPDLPTACGTGHEPVGNPDLSTACGTGHEPVDKLSDSSRNHEVAGNGVEFKNAAVIQNSSNLVSPETDSRAHSILPPSGSVDDEPNNDLFVEFQNHVSLSGPLPLHTNQCLLSEPLQIEFEKLCKDKDQNNKLHEDTKSQLNSELEKELQEMYDRIRGKFTTKLSEEEKTFAVKTIEMDANHKKILLNRLLAKAFRYKCQHFISSTSSDVVQQDAPIISQQQQLPPSSQSQSPVASFGQSATVNPLYSGHHYPASASTRPSTIQQIHLPMHSRPPQITTITSTIGSSARASGSNVRAAAPHLQPFRQQPPRPPLSSSHQHRHL